MTVYYDALTVDWLGHATLRLEAQTGAVVYLDPGRYGVLDDYDARDGDVVLVTHTHHYDPDGIARVAHDDAIVVVFEGVDATTTDRDVTSVDDLPYRVERVGEDEAYALGALDIVTVPAYNEPDGPHVRDDGSPYHPRGSGCGYLVTMDGVTTFWPGDTDVLPFHDELAVDLFTPPIGGSVTMDRQEAAALAEALHPGLTLPIHYDTFPALETDADAFVLDLAHRGLPVVLDEQGVDG